MSVWYLNSSVPRPTAGLSTWKAWQRLDLVIKRVGSTLGLVIYLADETMEA